MGKIISRISASVITILLGVWFNYLILPAWNFSSAGMWGFLLLMAVVGAVVFGVAECITSDWDGAVDYIGTIVILIVAGIILIIPLLIGGVSSSHFFNANAYHQIVEIQNKNEEDFKNDIPEILEDAKISIVDVGTAERVGDRTVGSIKNATWYEVDDEYNLIKYQGKYYRISELNYGSIFKYGKAKYDGIPGYVLVDVETQEAKYIELEEPIKYSPSAHYEYLLKRHLRKMYPSYIFGKSFFEINEEGTAFYITSVKTPTIGLFGGTKEESFVITNANTGECKEYKTEELPEWVDHAYDLEYLMRIIDNNQTYVDGFWNSITSKTGVNSTTYQYKNEGFSGYNTAITADGDIVFYTGVTPVSKSESNIGFILANPRTGEISYYTCAGAEESSAQQAAEGLLQNLGYTATFPTILNVDGNETYFMLMKDNAGLVQRYALCNVKEFTKVVQAETLEEAIDLYREKIGTKVEDDEDNEEENLTTEGNIEKLYQAQIDGCTFYYFTIEGDTNLYMSSIKNSNKQVMLTEGSKVSIEYSESLEDGVFIVKKIQF